MPVSRPSRPTAGRVRVAGARRQGRAAAKPGAQAPAVDEQVLGIVAAGDTGETTELDAAVEQALANDSDQQAEGGQDAADDTDEQAEGDDDAGGDEETSD